MRFHTTDIFAAILIGLKIAAVGGTEWELRYFNLTLENFNPQDSNRPRSGEVDFAFRETATARPIDCRFYWPNKSSGVAWQQCRPEIFYRVHNVSSSTSMEVNLDIAYLQQEPVFVKALHV
jgi:hypothetical protein